MLNVNSQPCVAIVNPAAGGGQCGRQAKAELDRLRSGGLSVEACFTTGAGDATDIARKAYAKGVRDFIAVGGDGTAFEVLNGLFPQALEASQRVRLGVLPLGTGNSFLRDFTDEGADYAVRAILNVQQRACDVIQLTHEDGVLYFLNLMSVGFVADVCAVANRRFKRLGDVGYVLGVLSEVARLKPSNFPMRTDGEFTDTEAVTFVSICNSRFTGGKMMMAPLAHTNDGQADLIRVGEMGRLSLLRTFPKIFQGTHVDHPVVSQRRVQTIDFNLHNEVDVMIDGEVLRLLPRRLQVLPGAIHVKV